VCSSSVLCVLRASCVYTGMSSKRVLRTESELYVCLRVVCVFV